MRYDDNPTIPPPRALLALRRNCPCQAEATQLGPPRHRFVSPDVLLQRIREAEEEDALDRAAFPRGHGAPPERLLRALRWR